MTKRTERKMWHQIQWRNVCCVRLDHPRRLL